MTGAIQRAVKRAIDIAGAAVGLVLFSPIMLYVAYRIRHDMGGGAIFSQTRAGQDGQPFRLYKFRSMTDERGPDGELLPDAQRLTPLGIKLRSTSLDELPQFWNVLRGDMSLVGPRPLLTQYVPLYDDVERRRLSVRPGITGWAQINGRNAISWSEKFALDVWYVDNMSVWLDIKILFLTVKTALKREGVSAAGEATMPAFTGHGEGER